jgi:RNA polymerase sigma-70 factor, ECF subfamily
MFWILCAKSGGEGGTHQTPANRLNSHFELYFRHLQRGIMALRQEDPTRLPSSPLMPEAGHDLAASLYAELHRLAAGKMRFERGNHTLQPTALVNEAYMRLENCSESMWQDRSRVLGLAANVMRHILVDYARAHRAEKRGDPNLQVTLDEGLVATTSSSTADVLAVDQALTRLAAFDSRQAEILEMHFFAGMTFEEISAHLGVSVRTVKRDWTMARAWLHQELSPSK